MENLGLAVGEGLVSMRRAATMLESRVDDLSDLFARCNGRAIAVRQPAANVILVAHRPEPGWC